MKGKLVLLGVAGAAVWGLALLDFGAHERAAEAPQDAEAAPEPLSPGQRPHAVRAEQAPAEQAAAAVPEPATAPARKPAPTSGGGVVRAAQGTVAVIGKAARSLFTSTRPQETATAEEAAAPARPPARATGELGEGARSPEYAAVERKYVGEARDGAWATAAEQRVRSLLERQSWSSSVSSLSCQQSTCQIVIESDAKDPFQQLLRVPGMSDATGIGPSTPYSLRSGQLSVYFSPPGDERADGR